MLNHQYHRGHLGSSSWITYTDGKPIQYISYTTFGNILVNNKTTTWSAPYTFSGKERDAETGFSYFGARYYDANLGIWLSVDPLAAKYPSLNPYTYCANNPIMLVDPDGMNFDEWDFDMSSGEFTWKSNKGGDNTQHINIVGDKGNYGSYSLSISTSDFKNFIDNPQTYKSNNTNLGWGGLFGCKFIWRNGILF